MLRNSGGQVFQEGHCRDGLYLLHDFRASARRLKGWLVTQYLGAVSSETPSLIPLGWESSKSRTAKWSAYVWTLHGAWFPQHGGLKLVCFYVIAQGSKCEWSSKQAKVALPFLTHYKQVTCPDWRGCDMDPTSQGEECQGHVESACGTRDTVLDHLWKISLATKS